MSKSFEQKMQRISEIAEALDRGGAPLADSLALYKEAIETLDGMRSELEEAEGSVIMMRKQPNGAYIRDEAKYEF